MNFDLQTLSPRDGYKLLTGVVVPRPIALVTSMDDAGRVNAAPFSFFSMIGADPPLVVLGIGNREADTPKDSARNILARGEFVVNMVDEALTEAMNICAVDLPVGVSEVEAARLELVPSQKVAVPRLAQSPASLECRRHSVLEIGRNRVIIGEVVALFVRDDLVDAAKFHIEWDKLGLIARMGGAGGYARTRDVFHMDRLSFAQWQELQEGAEEHSST